MQPAVIPPGWKPGAFVFNPVPYGYEYLPDFDPTYPYLQYPNVTYPMPLNRMVDKPQTLPNYAGATRQTQAMSDTTAPGSTFPMPKPYVGDSGAMATWSPDDVAGAVPMLGSPVGLLEESAAGEEAVPVAGEVQAQGEEVGAPGEITFYVADLAGAV